jgi:hypothetical protein
MAEARLPGGKRRLVVDLAARHAQRADERDPVGIGVAVDGGFVHEVADGVMDEQEAVEFLLGAVGMAGAQNEVASAEVGLDFVQRGLELPPLGVDGGQLGRRGYGGVKDRGDQSVDVVVAGDGVLDRPDPDPGPGVVDVALVEDLGEVGARPATAR